MRAKEFIVERKLPARKSGPMKAMYMFPDMPSSDSYQAYRFGMAMANHEINYADGPTEQKAVIVAYTPEEETIIRGGERQTGKKGRLVTDKQSREPGSTGTVSPVAKPKKNKFGV